MKIEKNIQIAAIQKEFNTTFPGLKIAFYKKGHEDHEGSPKQLEWDSEHLLSEVNPDLEAGDVALDNDKTVAQFEEEMEERFGLHVQVFRRSNTLWLQTVATDHWTLEVQNSKGIHSVQS